jgi:hypothetical protein
MAEQCERSRGPRFGEGARAQTAQSREDQAAYAQANAEFARGRREWNGGGGRNGNGNVSRFEIVIEPHIIPPHSYHVTLLAHLDLLFVVGDVVEFCRD